MGKTTSEMLHDPEYAKMFGAAFLFFIDEVEKKSMGPEMASTWFIEHPNEPHMCFEIQVAKLPKSHPDVENIVEPSKWAKP